MLSRIKGKLVEAYLHRKPDRYDVSFAGQTVQFLTDRPYPKIWYFRNRLRGAAHGYHEPAMTLLLERLSADKRSLLDIGAHLGYFSILFAALPGHEAAAVELDPTNFREMERAFNAQPEAVRQRLTALNIGIADAAGAIDVPQSRAHNSSHRIDSLRPEGVDTVSVALATIDDTVAKLKAAPDIVKIDVEGFEAHALRGASQLLANQHPVLLIELHPPQLRALGEHVSGVIDLTRAAGYRHFQFREHRGLQGSVLSEEVSLTGDANRDVICIHESDHTALHALQPMLAA